MCEGRVCWGRTQRDQPIPVSSSRCSRSQPTRDVLSRQAAGAVRGWGTPVAGGQRPVLPARGGLVFPIRQICGCLRTLLSPGPAQPSETSWMAARSGPPIGGRRTVGGPLWRPSKLACSEGWPCSAGRRLILPDPRFGR